MAESHLEDDNVLCVSGYQLCDNNRKDVHIGAKRKESGGLGVLVKQELLHIYTVTELDKSYEGIMWHNVSAKHSEYSFNISVCYLPPYKSSPKVDAEGFLDTFPVPHFCLSEEMSFYDLWRP